MVANFQHQHLVWFLILSWILSLVNPDSITCLTPTFHFLLIWFLLLVVLFCLDFRTSINVLTSMLEVSKVFFLIIIVHNFSFDLIMNIYSLIISTKQLKNFHETNINCNTNMKTDINVRVKSESLLFSKT